MFFVIHSNVQNNFNPRYLSLSFNSNKYNYHLLHYVPSILYRQMMRWKNRYNFIIMSLLLVYQYFNTLFNILCLLMVFSWQEKCKWNQLTVTGNFSRWMIWSNNAPCVICLFDFIILTMKASICCSLLSNIVLFKVASFSITSFNVAVVNLNWSLSDTKCSLK